MSARPRPGKPDARAATLVLLSDVLDRRRLLDEAAESDPDMAALADRDRAFARLLVATILRRLGQIDAVLDRCLEHALPPRALAVRHVLRLGAAQLLFLDTPPHAALSTSVELLKHTPLAGFAGLVNAVLRRLDREGRDWIAAQDAARLNTPDWMWESWRAAYGEETARAVAQAHLREAPLDITPSGEPEAWAERLEGTLLPTGSIRRASAADIPHLPGFAEGQWWVQDMAAALPTRLLGDVRGRRVADLCAAPGGKTQQLAMAGAEVVAVDRSARRLRRLADNLTRLGRTVRLVEADIAQWQTEERFDAVLLDAPCSATGTLRRHPDGLRLKQPRDVVQLAAAQARLLSAAAAMVPPGGTLVYCVCSLEPQEGAAQVEAFLAQGAPFVRQPVAPAEVGGLSELISPRGDLRTLPCHLAEQGGMDAFFAARLIRQPE